MKMMTRVALAAAAFNAGGTAFAQDGGNVLAALDVSVANVDTVIQGLGAADPALVADGVSALGPDLGVALADGTPLEGPAMDLAAAAGDLSGSFGEFGGLLDMAPMRPAGSGELPLGPDALTSLFFPMNNFSDGLPLISGEEVDLFTQQCTPCEFFGVPSDMFNMLLRVDLLGPGDMDGGGVLIPVFGGEQADGFGPFGDFAALLPLGDLGGSGMPEPPVGGGALELSTLTDLLGGEGGDLPFSPETLTMLLSDNPLTGLANM